MDGFPSRPLSAAISSPLGETIWTRLRGAARSEPSTAVGVPRFGRLAGGMVIEAGGES